MQFFQLINANLFDFRNMKELYSLDWEESGEMGLWDQGCFSLFPVWIRYFFNT